MADLSITSTPHNATDNKETNWGPFWADDQNGVMLYTDNGADIGKIVTSNGGTSWTATEIEAGNVKKMACWYEQGTPGDSGTLIHVAWLDVGLNECRYLTVDAADGTETTIRTVKSSMTVATTDILNRIAITKTKGGNVVITGHTQTGADTFCLKSSDNFATAGTSINHPWETETQEDHLRLFPANSSDNNDFCGLFWDRSDNVVSIKKYDDSANSWSETPVFTGMTDDTHTNHMAGSVRHSDGKLLVAAQSFPDDSTGDIRTAEIDVGDTVTVTTKTDVLTNTSGMANVHVAINQQNDDVYIGYLRGSGWGSSVGVYYKKSTDDMTTWGTETAVSEDVDDDNRQLNGPGSVTSLGGNIMFTWYNDDTTDIFTNLNNNVSISASSGATVAFTPTGLDVTPEIDTPTLTLEIPLSPTGLDTTPELDTPGITFEISFSPTGLDLTPEIDTPTLGVEVSLDPTGLVVNPELDQLSLSLVVDLSPTGLETTPELGTPTIDTVILFTPTGLIITPTVDTPDLTLEVPLDPTGVETTPTLGTPTITVGNVPEVDPSGLSSTPIIGKPDFSIVGIVDFEPEGLVVTPTIGRPILNGSGMNTTPITPPSRETWSGLRVEMTLNGSPVDFADLETLPFSLKKRIDDLTRTVGTDGLTLDNPASRIVLPGTKNNDRLMEHYLNPHSVLDEVIPEMDWVSTIDKNPVAVGKAVIHSGATEGEDPLNYSIGIRGGTRDLFSQLSQFTLRDLPLGESTWDQATIESSWTYNPSTDSVVWGPIWFQEPTGPGTNGFTVSDMRPSVPEWWIVKHIFESLLGVSIESNFYGLEYFRRHLHLYTSNELDAKDSTTYPFRVSRTADVPGTANQWVTIGFDDETSGTNGDNFNVITNGVFTVPANGDYRFKVQAFSTGGPTTQSLRMRVIGGTNAIYAIPLNLQVNGGVWTSPIIPLGNAQQVVIEFKTLNNSILLAGATWEGNRVVAAGVGSTVELSSCLPDRPVTEFLAGITHKYNLAWNYVDEIKQVRFEPRFSYILPDGTFHDGMYKSPNTTDPRDWSKRMNTQKVTTRLMRPWGSSVAMGAQPEDSELYKSMTKNDRDEIPLMGSKFRFTNTTDKGKTDLNPYYEDLILMSGFRPNTFGLPLVNPKQEVGEDPMLSEFDHGPKWAYYPGEISDYGDWIWEGITRTTRPALFQRPHTQITVDPPMNGSYGDYVNENTGNIIPGYFTIFWMKHMEMINLSRVIQGESLLYYSEFAFETFRDPILLQYMEDQGIYHLLELTGYRPGKTERATASFILQREPTEITVSRVSHDNRPAYGNF